MINHVMASLRPAARKGGAILSSIALAALALSSASCSSTKVVSFTNASAPSKVPVNSVVTVMADPRGELRAAVEDHLTRQLERNGVQAYSSYTKISTEVLQGDRDIARDALADWEADAVLVCRLTDRTDISEPPSFKSNVADWKQAWGTESLQSTEFEADTWGGEVTVTIHMESKLYRLSTAELLWVGHAETKLGETTDEVKRIQSVSKKLVSQLEKDGWIK